MDICDFHSHILPGADHGSNSLEESLAQLSLAKRYGINRIFATPHFYPHRDSVEAFIRRRDLAYSSLDNSLDSNSPDIKLGAEVLLCQGIEKLPGIETLCINGTNVMLLELPFNDFSRAHINSVEALKLNGIQVILAHAERYDPSDIDALLELDISLQVNSSVLCGIFRNKSVEYWKSIGKIVALGSDIHGVDKQAYKKFSLAKKRLGSYIEVIQNFSNYVWTSAQKGSK